MDGSAGWSGNRSRHEPSAVEKAGKSPRCARATPSSSIHPARRRSGPEAWVLRRSRQDPSESPRTRLHSASRFAPGSARRGSRAARKTISSTGRPARRAARAESSRAEAASGSASIESRGGRAANASRSPPPARAVRTRRRAWRVRSAGASAAGSTARAASSARAGRPAFHQASAARRRRTAAPEAGTWSASASQAAAASSWSPCRARSAGAGAGAAGSAAGAGGVEGVPVGSAQPVRTAAPASPAARTAANRRALIMGSSGVESIRREAGHVNERGALVRGRSMPRNPPARTGAAESPGNAGAPPGPARRAPLRPMPGRGPRDPRRNAASAAVSRSG